jgi:hypothetical protein
LLVVSVLVEAKSPSMKCSWQRRRRREQQFRRLSLVVLIFFTEQLFFPCCTTTRAEDPPPPRRRHDLPQPTIQDLEKYEETTTTQKDIPLIAPFDTNVRTDCRGLLDYCQSAIHMHVYLQCPALCTKYLEQEGSKGVAEHNTEFLWEGTLRTVTGDRIQADRFEGSVLVIALLPLLPGMAKYYYDMMEALHEKFRPKVEFIILPIDVGEGIHLKLRPQSSVVVLEEESAILSHPWVQHLWGVKPRSGAASKDHRGEIVQVELPTDRLTIYLVSADGYFVERMTVPTMAVLQKQISIYLRTMDYIDL